MRNWNELLEKEIEIVKKIASIVSPFLPYKNEWGCKTLLEALKEIALFPKNERDLIIENLDRLLHILELENEYELTEEQKEERNAIEYNYLLLSIFRIPLLILESKGKEEFLKIIEKAILEVRNKFFGEFFEENSSKLGNEIYSKTLNFEIKDGSDIKDFIYKEFFKYIGSNEHYIRYIYGISKQIHLALWKEANGDIFIDEIKKLFDEIVDIIVGNILNFLNPIIKDEDIEKILISIIKGGEEK
jgi:hypothetical protein